jgi:AcrR family transcriptional regulator
MSRKAVVSPRKSPVQTRSEQTVEAILAAATRVLIKSGAAGFTTNKVAERAGVSIGSLYQYFPNKESILGELARRHLEDLERGINDITGQAPDAPLAEVVRALIEDNVRAHLIDPRLHGALTEQVQQLGRFRWQDEFGARVFARVRALLEAHRSELAVKDLDLATYIVTHTVEACVHEGITERPQDMESGALARDLTRMILGYLTNKAV